jgi:hypothetical protein
MTFADWWAAVPYPMGVGSRDIARAAWDAATAAERERIAGLFAGAAGRVKVRNASGERIDLISPELGDEIVAVIRQSPSS